MNYLAHSYLSCMDEDILIGNIITDFLTKKQRSGYDNSVLKGIELHQEIDSYTDAHPASKTMRKLLRKRHGKYAPVVVDLIWDYALSYSWSDYSGSTLLSFTKSIYEVLERRRRELPEKFRLRLDRMIQSDFLMAYSNKERMLSSLKWMDNRVSFPSNFPHAMIDLEENESMIHQLFSEFFPDIIKHVELHCPCD